MTAKRFLPLMAGLILALFFHQPVWAQAIKDWKGQSNNSQWNNAANWEPVGIPAPADVVRIGVVASNQSTISVDANMACAAMEFGTTGTHTLSINSPGKLSVAGGVIINIKPNATKDARFTVTITGSGQFSAGSIQVGNDLQPAAALTGRTYTRLDFGVAQATITGNIIINSVADDVDGTYYPEFYLNDGTLTLNGQIETRNAFYYVESFAANSVPQYRSMFRCYELINNPVLIFKNTEPIRPLAAGHCIDFTDSPGGLTTIIYENNSSTPQTVYPSGQVPVGQQPGNYKKIEFRGNGPKIVAANPLNGSTSITILNTWTSESGKIDLTTNNTTLEFAGTSQTITDNGTNGGIIFRNLTLSGSGTKTLASVGNRFGIAANGILRNSRIFSTNSLLTLKSDANSSATVAALPAGARIDGIVQVERFLKGSGTDLSRRGYRLISSPVNTATPTIGSESVRTYDPNFLLDNTFVSGLNGAANGFNVAGNPTLYLYREDIVPNGSTFTSSNYKGIARLNSGSPFAIGTQNRFNINNTADTAVNIPVGTGLLYFFRGDKSNNSTQSGTKTTLPFDYPEDVTLTASGNLNQGTVNVRSWYAQPDQNRLSYTTAISNNTAGRNVRGYHLVGNPYASPLNWNKLNRNADATKSTIYAQNIERSIWFFNPENKQYAAYLAPLSGDTTNAIASGTNGAGNIIAPGQGFFVRATAPDATLSFREAAKTISQPTAVSLNKFMGMPAAEEAPGFLKVELWKDAVNTDDIVIRLDNTAQENYHPDKDAEDMGGNGAVLSLSVLSHDNLPKKMAIHTTSAVKKVNRFLLFVDAVSSGVYELRKTAVQNMADKYEIWLIDHFTKDSIDFGHQDKYTFRMVKSVSETFGANRFELVLKRKPQTFTLANEPVLRDKKPGVMVYPNPAKFSATLIMPPNNAGKKELRIYNMKGQMIRRIYFDTDSFTFNVTPLQPGNYLLEISDNGIQTQRQKFIKI